MLTARDADIVMSSVMNCRTYFQPQIGSLGLGNYAAALSQDEQVKSDTSFWDLARSVSASTEKELGKLKQFTELPVLNMLFAQVSYNYNLLVLKESF